MYRFLMEAIFTYTIAVYMFRAGVRRNNTDVIIASSETIHHLLWYIQD